MKTTFLIHATSRDRVLDGTFMSLTVWVTNKIFVVGAASELLKVFYRWENLFCILSEKVSER